MADFAAARFSRVILVECLVDLREDGAYTQLLRSALAPPPSLATLMSCKIDHKLALAKVAELWFVVEEIGRTILKQKGYVGSRLPKPRTPNFRELVTGFWLYRPSIVSSA